MLLELAINLVASIMLLGAGFVGGKYRERKLREGRNLEEYAFYPFGQDEEKHVFFDAERFSEAVRHFLKHRDDLAARQLILVGEQNDVRNTLGGDDRSRYVALYQRYRGDEIRDDTAQFLENFKRIVRLVGDSFPDCGIEILLHDLTNPSKALSLLKNNVTGRNVEAPATNLVLDLKMRRELNQDKLNYELNIGARRFKCTTIPIFREGYGLVGAICINVDANYLTDAVLADRQVLESFVASLCKTDMQLDENILSKEEHAKALAGKRHFRDFSAAPA